MCDVGRFLRGITCEKDMRLGEEGVDDRLRIDGLVALEGSGGVGEGSVALAVFDVYE